MIPGISWFKVGAVVAIGVAAASAVALTYRHYSQLVQAKVDLSAEVATLREDVSREKARGDALESTVKLWSEASRRQAEALELLAAAQREAGAYQRGLVDVLSKHDLGELAKRKPGLIEDRINAGTERALRLLERATEGAAATPGGPAAAAGSTAPAADPR